MKANITITLKAGLLDAQGKTIKSALESLGFKGVREVRVGKCLEIELNHARANAAKRDVERMCRKLLANPVVEQYRIEIAQGSRLKALGSRGTCLEP
ncbi:MAG: phosphoribosylformylglycinamidine synthase subunit PurS [Candidatus Omnitrophica bacterium]|nr:phosphoribosylformylglycinamidine synthase subunit PurS [Candidatus Omnitrophota bacterium]